VKRTLSISTTDLVGRMLLCTKTHFIKSLRDVIDGTEGSGTEEEKKAHGQYVKERLTVYATDESGKNPGSSVWFWKSSNPADADNEGGEFENFVAGTGPLPGQRVVYVDGGFDLFSSGHIEFLRQVVIVEEDLGRERGWYSEAAKQERIETHGKDYSPVFVVAGVHDDETINLWKGVNYPIMNILERGLCVLQCKVRITSPPFLPIPRCHPRPQLFCYFL
jgi:ethanolamine-phosphate cytidylyltransferase